MENALRIEKRKNGQRISKYQKKRCQFNKSFVKCTPHPWVTTDRMTYLCWSYQNQEEQAHNSWGPSGSAEQSAQGSSVPQRKPAEEPQARSPSPC